MKLLPALAWISGRAEAPPEPARLRAEPPPLRLAPPPVLALPAPAPKPPPRADLHHISPRQFADLAHELYFEGRLNWQEYRMVGFPSELDPRFDETIGALTGEKAEPDNPRDMLAEWERRVDFERRYTKDDRQVRRAERILAVLRQVGE